MNKYPILFFDSGLGGLTVMRAARLKLPGHQFIYVADDAYFPYGEREERQLKEHILNLFATLVKRFNPCLCVLACNTASTLVLEDLRLKFPQCLFVGTVPAIKLASQNTHSGLITVLATPATVKRDYTQNLINSYAQNCEVTLVGAKNLATISENYVRTNNINTDILKREIISAFICKANKYTDIIVLACTHYPFLINEMRNVAPWPVDWLDPSEAIANRIKFLLDTKQIKPDNIEIKPDLAYFTSSNIDFLNKRLLQAFGLTLILDNS